MSRDLQPVVVETIKKLADAGKLIEAGWVGYLHQVVPADAGQVQKEECRRAFFAGAQMLFSSMMTMLEPGQDATDNDLHRMDLLNAELDAFVSKLKG